MTDVGVPRGPCGRADLLRALVASGGALADAMPALIGYARMPQTQVVPVPGAVASPPGKMADLGTGGATTGEPSIATTPLAPTAFWYLAGYAARGERAPDRPADGASGAAPPSWSNRPEGTPANHPLATWPDLRRRLRPRLADLREVAEPDLERTVTRIARGVLLDRLPQRRRLRLPGSIQLVFDRSERLVPYWSDQDQVAAELAALLPVGALERAVFHEGLTAPRLLDQGPGYRPPLPGALVLVLGDLGSLSAPDRQAPWYNLGRALAAAGCRAVALMPGRAERVPRCLRALWRVVPWERPCPMAELAADTHNRSAGAEAGRVRRLLMLLAPALRIEPGLLRAMRLSLGDAACDAALESALWQDPAVASTHSEAAALDPGQRRELLAEFARETPQSRKRALALLRAWRAHLPPEIWFEEVLNLAPELLGDLPEPQDLEDARRFFAYVCTALSAAPLAPSPLGAWVRRVGQRAVGLWQDPAVGQQMLELDWRLHQQQKGYRPPASIDPAGLPPLQAQPLVHELRQQGSALVLVPRGARGGAGVSPLGRVESANGLVQVSPAAALEARDSAFWEGGRPPGWARAWGWDGHGAWASFAVQAKDGSDVVQRLRWIPPGTFQMGSPADEPGRWDDEGPRHPVTLADGYWLFDTPCTQALWAAVMGSNPSRFQSPERPVERVSWEDVQGFLTRLNGEIPGLALALPTEAQWEYACRAGTQMALYSGPIEIVGEKNAPALDPIAWYGGNSGVGFELEDGYDSSDWTEVQHPNPKSGTHPVGRKDPNPWGLYDMLGNVWEWTQDAWHGSYSGAPADGSAWETTEAGADRVIRGGSWNDGARDCRCAYRSGYGPGSRPHSSLGFRCARVQVSEAQGAGTSGASGPAAARPAERIRPGGGGPDSRSGAWGDSGTPSATPVVRAGMPEPSARDGTLPGNLGTPGEPQSPLSPITLRLDTAAQASAPLPDTQVLEVRTDREVLTLRRTPKPAWASAMGRDRFGLWAEIAIGPSSGPAVIQRLRWIPPGCFQMGSPEDEPGRWDDEGPRHLVTLDRGYWLFDTPCTQALWQAVMGDNPSTFKSPERPVEGVSWEDVQQRFLPALNAHIPGFLLPSEAQWEHACRAGTQTALYSGPIEILGDANAPALDPIAWYGGNSNLGFDLDNGQERSWLTNMQYPGGTAGTHPVKAKAPNPWGLYDMLGNVWEWTQDAWHGSYSGAPADGSAWETTEAGADRVIRGGSWDDFARLCRCASRSRYGPDYRNLYLGFRCARVQVS